MTCPGKTDYLAWVQSPDLAFGDPKLRGGKLELNSQGFPKSWAGAFATVFRIRSTPAEAWAVRCFTQMPPDLLARYQAFAAFLARAEGPLKAALVQAHCHPQGVKNPATKGPWYPVVKMAWCAAPTLTDWLQDQHRRPGSLRGLQRQLRFLAQSMEAQGFIHGDLQHRNLLIGAQGPILVDYDSILLPGLEHLGLGNQGLPSFRHPLGGPATPPICHDRFAFQVLDLGLEILIHRPELFARWGEREGLLFSASDFRTPLRSEVFQAAWADPRLQSRVEAFARLCTLSAEAIPLLAPPTPLDAQGLPPLASHMGGILDRLYPEISRPQAPLLPGATVLTLPVRFTLAPAPAAPTPSSSQGIPALPPSPTITPTPSRPSRFGRRLLLTTALAALAFLGFHGVRLRHPGVASPRKELVRYLEARKDVLIDVVVKYDVALEQLRGMPQDMAIAVIPSPGADPVRRTVAQYRYATADEREAARQALLRCNDTLAAFDRAMDEPGRTPSISLEAFLAEQSIPEPIQARLRQSLRTKGLP